MSESLSLSRKEFVFYTASILSMGYSIYEFAKYIIKKVKKSDRLDDKNLRVRNGILDMMRDTPLIYIKSLSELTGCKIYGKCEYFLPYTSKDRMIKNIILDAQR
jgi:cysteine synthase